MTSDEIHSLTLLALDYFFLLFHTSLIFFNLFGWIWPKTRKWNLLCLLATAFSWFVLGIRYGFGYCICTDWHWQILTARGIRNLPNSYITYLIERFSGIHPDEKLVDIITGTTFVVALLCSIASNIAARRASDKHAHSPR
jgi:hypothetical protein